MHRQRVLILGAAGRDFHDFNVRFRHDQAYEVIGFTAAQIPGIESRTYPSQLSGPLYPHGIPIHPEVDMPHLIRKHGIDVAVMAYSDLSHQQVMEKAAIANAAGAGFWMPSPRETMLKSRVPVVAITAVRTGCGKSPATRRVLDVLRGRGLKVISLRHPMPYGDLAAQKAQRFADYADLDAHRCTIEEREEYEPHIDRGAVIYAGVDYADILASAEDENPDVILWDGGNNDFPFVKPDLWITVVDPLRPGHESTYYPGLVNLISADVVIINKEDSADPGAVEAVRAEARRWNPRAAIIDADSPVTVDNASALEGQRVLVVEDGPTVTHGGMGYGAGFVAALKAGVEDIVDPRPFAVGSIAETFEKYPHLKAVLPAMGYGDSQIADLRATMDRAEADVIVIGTPIDLRRVMELPKPGVRARYELREKSFPDLAQVIDEMMARGLAATR